MMLARQVVQQEMDVEVVWMSRLWIICISQVSTTTRRNIKHEFPEISSHRKILVLLLQECDKTLPQIVTLPTILLSVYYLVK